MKSLKRYTTSPVLETKRLLLRPFEPEDAPAVYQYASDPQIGWNCGWPAHSCQEESRTVIERMLMVPGTWAITLKERPEHAIGSISLMEAGSSNLPLQDDELEIGFWIGRPFWNQGYMGEAAACLRDFAFETLDTVRLKASYAEFNPASGAVQRKIGMKKDGVSDQWMPLLESSRRSVHMSINAPARS